MGDRVPRALPFGVMFAVCLCIGLFSTFRARSVQNIHLRLFLRFPRFARFVPFKGHMASKGYLWTVRLVGVIYLVFSVLCLLGTLGALE